MTLYLTERSLAFEFVSMEPNLVEMQVFYNHHLAIYHILIFQHLVIMRNLMILCFTDWLRSVVFLLIFIQVSVGLNSLERLIFLTHL